MRSKLLVCAAIAAFSASPSLQRTAYAAHAKKKVAAPKAAAPELHADDKAMKKQLQWEDKVMGPDSKRAELDKIARAHALNEKAEKDRERQEALEAAAPAPKASGTSASNRKADKAEVSLIAPEPVEANHAREISPKLDTAAAQAPVKAAKPDDKFIDKLLREEDAPSKARATANDKELEGLLAGAQEKSKPAGRKKGDSVDALLRTADKGPAMPPPRAQSGGLPDWAKTPEIAPDPAPAPAPVVARTPKSTAVIQVVQGAAASSSARATVASRPGRKTAAPQTTPAWDDPFAEKRALASTQAPKKEAASRPSASRGDSAWNDPFADPGDAQKTVRHTAPASTPTGATKRSGGDKGEPSTRPAGNQGGDHGGDHGWKDPFTQVTSSPAHAPVAMRDVHKGESPKWELAARRPSHASSVASSSETRAVAASDTHAVGAWGVLKKRAR